MAESNALRSRDDLIVALSRDTASLAPERRGRFVRYLATTAALALLIAVATIFLTLGPRPQIADHVTPVAFKLAAMLALAGAALAGLLGAVLPARSSPSLAFIPALAIVALRIATDGSGQPLFGVHQYSAAHCVTVVVLTALVPLALILSVARRGAATSPRRAGAYAGALAGALAAAGYGLACRNDAGLFLLVWYPLAVALTAGIGCLLGRRALAW